MDSKITIPITIIVSIIVTAGIMYSMNFDQLAENSRTFYIEDILYTTSESYIKMNSFDDLEEINSIKLGNTGKFVNYLEENITR